MANESLIRHGDVPLLRISKEKANQLILAHQRDNLRDTLVGIAKAIQGQSVRDTLSPASREIDRVILAYGEQSGHVHVIEQDGVEVFSTDLGDIVLIPVGGADLKHIDQSGALTGEHATINLEEGYWLRLKQREWTLQGNRNVTD